MKIKVVSLILALMLLMSSSVMASSFPDVPDTHWALNYIEAMKAANIINGFEDGTFKPENLVKHGEFIKMITLCKWKVLPDENLPEGTHWVEPYAKIANHFIINKTKYYNPESYEKPITRAEAVRMLWRMYQLQHSDIVADKTEQYLKSFIDEIEIEDEEMRYYFNACIQYGLINGFEDGTLRPNATLTRAQATKILSSVYAR